MIDPLLITAAALVVGAIVVLVDYIGKLHKAQKEYERAKEATQDIVLSFNRQLRRVAEQLERVAYKVEANSSRSERALSKGEEVEKQMQSLVEKVNASLTNSEGTSASLVELGNKLRDVISSHETLTSKVSSLEEQTRQLPVSSEANIEAVIPIRRDKALAPLTPTELAALETLATEGPKTAPEIKWRIKLSREHTARLMKKLYEEGYLERDPSKIPFKYSVKKEMERLLTKTESGAPQE